MRGQARFTLYNRVFFFFFWCVITARHHGWGWGGEVLLFALWGTSGLGTTQYNAGHA